MVGMACKVRLEDEEAAAIKKRADLKPRGRLR